MPPEKRIPSIFFFSRFLLPLYGRFFFFLFLYRKKNTSNISTHTQNYQRTCILSRLLLINTFFSIVGKVKTNGILVFVFLSGFLVITLEHPYFVIFCAGGVETKILFFSFQLILCVSTSPLYDMCVCVYIYI